MARPAHSSLDWYVPSPDGRYVGFAGIVAYQVQAPARDGTPVPLSVIHRKDLSRDGDNPTLLEAYGSYGLVLGP
jgi:prolyl oligopeptidase